MSGCGLTLDYEPPDDATVTDAGSADAPVPTLDAPGLDAPGLDAPGLDAPVADAPNLDAPLPDAPDRDAPPDVGPVECAAAADCDVFGPPPCGAWECNAFVCEVVCAGCTTDVDRDGYGIGAGCAGLDCDDTDDLVGPTSSRACYGGPGGTSGVGACTGGTEDCVAGTWTGACLGQIVPGAESCNGLDDDCNGATDESIGTVGCGLGACATTVDLCAGGALATCNAALPITTIDGCNALDDDCDGRVDESCTNCVWVGPAGNDGSLDPRVVVTPFRTVQAAINYAAADAARPQRVCLLSTGCSNAMVIYNGAVRMAQGVTVQGSYGPSGGAICPTIRTEIRTADATGVSFPDVITGGLTTLADVAITPTTISDTAGVTIDGAVGVVLRNVSINTTSGGVTNGHGVRIIGGGDALITRSSIFAGRGSATANGIHVDGGRVTVLENCPVALDAAGRCPSGCPWMTASAGIRGRGDITPSRGALSYAILLRNAPGSLITSSATCGHTSNRGAGVRIEGDGSGTVLRGNYLAGYGGELESYGVDLADCADASPWIVDNSEINAEGPLNAPIACVRSLGACHPIIERNLRIVSGLEGRGAATAILCGAGSASGASSRCVIERNPSIRSTQGGFPPSSTGVRCEANGCARIVQNDISAFQGRDILGLYLGTTDAFVSRNRISGGCATGSATGVQSVDSRARLENNIIFGATPCMAGTASTATRFIALTVGGTSARGLLDVHSNTLDPAGVGSAISTCISRGIELGGTSSTPLASIRGNIVLPGACRMSHPVFELSATADPFALEHNDLVPAMLGAPIYRDEGASDLVSSAAVNALLDTSASGNIETPPGFVSYPGNLDLAGGSMCIDADMSVGAPAIDFDGHARIGVPDIGAYEG